MEPQTENLMIFIMFCSNTIKQKQEINTKKTKKCHTFKSPSVFLLTVHTAFGLPGNSDTAISDTWKNSNLAAIIKTLKTQIVQLNRKKITKTVL